MSRLSRLPIPTRLPRTKGQWAATLVVLLVTAVLWGCQARGDEQVAGPQESPHTTATHAPTPYDHSDAAQSGPQDTDPVSGLAWVSLAELPHEAAETLELIDAGGPFPYDRDGVVFGNREGILPDRSRGYYHEYTVPTPGEEDRGARRIVAGSGGEYYWTGDHYSSFERIAR